MNFRAQRILDTANKNLTALYGEKHRPILSAEVEAVYSRNILSIQADAKTVKGSSQGYLTGILYLAPSKLSGIDICPFASKGCIDACLFSAGRGRFYLTTRQRVLKTVAYHIDQRRFVDTLKVSIRKLKTKAKNKGMIPVVRLNGTSDIAFDTKTDIIQEFSDTQFYDYTKIPQRFLFPLPKNYSLTFSLSEDNEVDARFVLSRGENVAVVFKDGILPKEYMGYPVVNGDDTDLRFLDPKGCIIGLKAKGRAKLDTSGFVKSANCFKIAA